MLVEIITAVVLIQGLGLLSQLIERRRDVFYYVSKPDLRAEGEGEMRCEFLWPR
jgi:hypothetical protein